MTIRSYLPVTNFDRDLIDTDEYSLMNPESVTEQLILNWLSN